MKWIKTYETFLNDEERGEAMDYPTSTPVDMIEAKDYVDMKLKSNEFAEIFKAVGVEPPKDLTHENIEEKFDEVREKAIKYFTDNPEEIKMPPQHQTYRVNGGDGISRTQNIGGSSHANSRSIGESKKELDGEINITDEEMDAFSKEELLQDLIRNGSVRLSNKKVFFNKKDKETIDTLDNFLEFDKKSFNTDSI
jgi:hypothetical protein